MKQKEKNPIITTREFVREFSNLTRKGSKMPYTIVKYGKPIGIFIPYLFTEEGNECPQIKTKKRVSFADLEKLRFRSGTKNLSQRIDEITYGVTR